MHLPSDLQRLLPYIVVAVLAVVGLVLVMRGMGDGGSATDPGRTDRGGEIRRDGSSDRGSGRAGSNRGGRSDSAGERAPRRSSQAYVSCVEQAADTAALEKCQALLP
ncbi:MAG: hypothetical protein ACRDLQ_11320 [Solirubrobacterales bacterium]